jgi:ABC-type branched-subunit amino acid transport system substrate-binding protein
MAATAAWFKQHHYTNVGILAQLNGLSQSENQYLLADLKAAGIRYTVATFPPTAVDVKPQISKLQAAGAQVIYGEALGPAAGYIGKGRAQLGLVSRPLVFDPGAGSEDLTKLMSAAELKNSYEVTWGANDPAQKYPGRDLLIKYAQPFGGVTAQPVSLGGFQWTDLILARNAAQQAKSIDTDAMVNALDHLSQKAQTDPLYLSARALLFTAENHEDAIPNGQAAYVVVPVGPLVGGLVKYR